MRFEHDKDRIRNNFLDNFIIWVIFYIHVLFWYKSLPSVTYAQWGKYDSLSKCLFPAWYRVPCCRPIRRCHSTCYDRLFSGNCTTVLQHEEYNYFCGGFFLHWSPLGRPPKAPGSCNIKYTNICVLFGIRVNTRSLSDNMWIINRFLR